MELRQKIFIGILCAIFVGAGIYLLLDYRSYSKDQDQLEDLRASAVEDISEVVDSDLDFDENLLRKVDFGVLKNQNSDTHSWLFIPDTNIDSPVMQEPEVGSYFYDLNGFDKTYNGAGSFLIPKAPLQKDGQEVQDAHRLILGHRMAGFNGEWQFSHLPIYWTDYDTAIDRPYIYTYHEDRAQRWRVWAGADVNGQDSPYTIPYELHSEAYRKMIDEISEKARFELIEKPSGGMQTIVLSTCHTADHGNEARYILVGVLDSEYIYETEEYRDMRDVEAQRVWHENHKTQRDTKIYDYEQTYRELEIQYNEEYSLAKKDYDKNFKKLEQEAKDLEAEIALREGGADASDILRLLDKKRIEETVDSLDGEDSDIEENGGAQDG